MAASPSEDGEESGKTPPPSSSAEAVGSTAESPSVHGVGAGVVMGGVGAEDDFCEMFDSASPLNEVIDANRKGVVGFGPGSVRLVEWVPQVAVLAHSSVVAFWTHGGSNSVGEAVFARKPLLCVPLFSDQPYNCRRASEAGFAEIVQWPALVRLESQREPPFLTDALLRRIIFGNATKPALEQAWISVVGAGGAPSAVQAIELAAARGLAHFRDAARPWRAADPRLELTGWAGFSYSTALLAAAVAFLLAKPLRNASPCALPCAICVLLLAILPAIPFLLVLLVKK